MRQHFSVVMSVYEADDPLYFRRAVSSVFEYQTIKPSEIVVVQDGPLSSELDDAISELKHSVGSALKVCKLEENCGLGVALAEGVKASAYDLIARMDSDDVSEPTRFEQQLAVFEKDPSVDIVGGDILEFIGDENNIVSLRSTYIDDSSICKDMQKRCAMNHVTVMFDRRAVNEAGGYLPWHFNEDYYLWIRMMQHKAKFANTGTVLCKVRVGSDMYARRGGLSYFKSELGLQNLMLSQRMIGFPRYVLNVGKRFAVQVLMPKAVRAWVFQKFARNSPNLSKKEPVSGNVDDYC